MKTIILFLMLATATLVVGGDFTCNPNKDKWIEANPLMSTIYGNGQPGSGDDVIRWDATQYTQRRNFSVTFGEPDTFHYDATFTYHQLTQYLGKLFCAWEQMLDFPFPFSECDLAHFIWEWEEEIIDFYYQTVDDYTNPVDDDDGDKQWYGIYRVKAINQLPAELGFNQTGRSIISKATTHRSVNNMYYDLGNDRHLGTENVFFYNKTKAYYFNADLLPNPNTGVDAVAAAHEIERTRNYGNFSAFTEQSFIDYKNNVPGLEFPPGSGVFYPIYMEDVCGSKRDLRRNPVDGWKTPANIERLKRVIPEYVRLIRP